MPLELQFFKNDEVFTHARSINNITKTLSTATTQLERGILQWFKFTHCSLARLHGLRKVLASAGLWTWRSLQRSPVWVSEPQPSRCPAFFQPGAWPARCATDLSSGFPGHCLFLINVSFAGPSNHCGLLPHQRYICRELELMIRF